MKKKLAFIILVTLCLSAYAEDFTTLNGIWRNQYFYDNVTSNPVSYGDVSSSYKQNQGQMEIKIKPDGTGSGWYVKPFGIFRIEQLGDNELVLYMGYPDYVSNPDSPVLMPAGEIVITVVDEDSMLVNFGNFGGADYDRLWYRVSGSAKIPVQRGVINDTRVRLRTKPNLECDTWGFFNTGDKVTIIDKSTETQKIDDMEDYWYKVRTTNFPDGWVYGAFIDIEGAK